MNGPGAFVDTDMVPAVGQDLTARIDRQLVGRVVDAVRLKMRTTPLCPVPPTNTPNCLLLLASLSTMFISAPLTLCGKTTNPLRVLFEAVLLDTTPNELPSKRMPC